VTDDPPRPRFDWRATLALIWAGVFAVFYARMVVIERFPALAAWFGR